MGGSGGGVGVAVGAPQVASFADGEDPLLGSTRAPRHRPISFSRDIAATLEIPRAHVRKGAKGSEVVFYEVRSARRSGGLAGPRVTDVAFKRFSDFAALDAKLRKNYGGGAFGVDLPSLPPKKMFGNLDPKFVEARRLQLEAYLTALVNHQGGSSSGGADERLSMSSQSDNSSNSLAGSGLSLLQASEDLRAFVPRGFLTEPPEELLRFEVVQINTFGSNRSMQLTVQPKVDGLLQFRDASGSAGLDSLARKIVLPVCDLLGAVDVEGSHVRATMFYRNAAEDAHHRQVGANMQPGRSGGAPPPPRSNAPTAPSSLSTTSTLTTHANLDWLDNVDADQSIGASMPSSAASGLNGGSGTTAARTKKRTLEFHAFEDRQRFVRLVRHLQGLKEGASTTTTIPPTTLPTATTAASPSTPPSPVVTPAVSPNSLALYPAPTHASASVFTTSWNQAKEPEPDDLGHWIPRSGGGFDVLAIGVQECPTSLGDLSDAVSRHLGSGYYIVGRKALWEIKLIVYARVEAAPFIHRIETDSVATGIMGIMGNKGGVGVAFRLHNVALAFVNTHLAPHMERYVDRNRMFDEIDSALRIGVGIGAGGSGGSGSSAGGGPVDLDASLKFDHVFWLGDLNYRLEIPHQYVVDLSATRQFDLLFPKDQLRRAQWSQQGFAGYSEGAITFPPTYKYIMPKKRDRKGRMSISAPVLNATGAKVNNPMVAAALAAAQAQAAAATTASTVVAPVEPLPSVTEEAEEELGQSVKPTRSLLSSTPTNGADEPVRMRFATLTAPPSTPADRSVPPSPQPASRSLIVPATSTRTSLTDEEKHDVLHEGESSDEEEEEEEEEEEDLDDGHSDESASHDECSSEEDTISAKLIAATLASKAPSTSPTVPSAAALDADDAAIFDSLDPDFAAYTRTRAPVALQPPVPLQPQPAAETPVATAPTTTTDTDAAAPSSISPSGASKKSRRSVSLLNGANSAFADALAAHGANGPLSAAHIAEERKLTRERKSIPRRRSATVMGQPKRRVFSRTYGKKRIPSWCDRILFRSHASNQIDLRAYYRCDLVATSDHIPVVATFDLRVPLCPPLGAYSYPASVLFSDLTLDLTVVLPTATRSEKGSGARLDKIYVTFYGAALAETSRGKRTGYATMRTPDAIACPTVVESRAPASSEPSVDVRPLSVLATWSACDIPVLQCVLGDAAYLALESVYFVVRSGDEVGGDTDRVLGQGRIPLASLVELANTNSPTATTTPLTAHVPLIAGNKTSPFASSLGEGQDGSVGPGTVVRAPPSPHMFRPPTAVPDAPNSWNFCGLIERHSAAIGTLTGRICVNMERPEVPDEVATKLAEEKMIAEVLADE